MKAHGYGSLAVVENSAETDSVLTDPESVLTPPEYLRNLRNLYSTWAHRDRAFGAAPTVRRGARGSFLHSTLWVPHPRPGR